ncbi:MAG: ATP-binding protein [Devosia sp.]|nr:ATP-binding protein [Devosia sp.]
MVNVVNRSMYPVQTGMNLISKMQDRFAQLQVQLATGQKATNLAEMGTDRFVTLSMQSRISRIEGYQNSIDMVNMRLSVFDQVIGRLDKVESNARAAISPSAYGSSNVNFGTAPSLARSQLDEMINLLNTEVDGRYLFAGGSVDKRPVETIGALLDGANGKDGYIQVAAEKVRRFLETHGAGEADVTGIDVALDEILTNVVNYGFEDGGAHEIVLVLSIASNLLTIEVQDDGRPFDPLGIPEPDLEADLESRQIGGLGMHFVRTLLDRVSYSRRNGWNVLKLEKHLVAEAEKAS